MNTLLRILGVLVVIVVVIALVAGSSLYMVVQRSLPQTSGTLAIAGLQDSVEVIRDEWGVPHIYAQNQDDLFFAEGYVMAQDRLWQMEFNRRVAAGRLSEFGGASTLNEDILLRSLGLYRTAQTSIEHISPQALRPMEAFARGINAFADTHKNSLPLEFTVLNTLGGASMAWEPWTVVDTAAIGNVMALSLSMNMRIEIFRTQIRTKLGEARAAELEPGYPASGPFILHSSGSTGAAPSAAGAAASAVTTTALADLEQTYDRVMYAIQAGRLPSTDDTALPLSGIGSNNWVVAGSRTASSRPFLANDPHLGIQNPSIWYEVHLEAPDVHIAGVTFAGVPGVVLGHNDRIAWGATNGEVDVQDMYVEKINPANPSQYEYGGAWVEGQVWHEEIKVKGQAAPVVRDILVTQHGPIITEGVKDRISEPVALRWSLYEQSGSLFQAVSMLWRARNWDDFEAALRQWDAPAQNMVYADVDGNIGYRMPGFIPVRAQGDGSAPVPGWTGEYEWVGRIAFEDMPSAYNPVAGFVATANNRPVDYSYPYELGSEWAPPYRAQRIEGLITSTAKLTIQDMRDIQADVYSIPDMELIPYIAALPPANDSERRALAMITAWNGRTSTDSVSASLMESMLTLAMRYTFADDLGKLADDYLDNGVPVLLRILPDNSNTWFDDITTPAHDTRRRSPPCPPRYTG